MYEFLKKFFGYPLEILVGKWYCNKRWPLWVRSVCEEKISILKIIMFVKGYWKVVKFF
ncbi:hypothetical protein RhiirA4_327373 [Rhizophagus irregularis]|uniref:Uncharacterized protein n=1 Tax=Rhizophagus irregularis TaxID=588596 RepID=A0A2I1H2W6_9GLOM|nr:hypothetical protein RhiirA4_327373 [Rhizophagus irregularis]